jgi:hypothetical protein
VGDDGDRQQREEVRHRTLGAAMLRHTLSGSAIAKSFWIGPH